MRDHLFLYIDAQVVSVGSKDLFSVVDILDSYEVVIVSLVEIAVLGYLHVGLYAVQMLTWILVKLEADWWSIMIGE